ncbi:MAG: hypothetical protein QMD61_00400 [Methanobacterium sp.]|nr:hypothetical protein [Methanobacterium sp.]
MKKKYMEIISTEQDFDIAGMYFLEHNLQKSKYVDEEDLLEYISSIIEVVTISSCIDDVTDEYVEYIKYKSREMIWLAAKSRFRAKSNLYL